MLNSAESPQTIDLGMPPGWPGSLQFTDALSGQRLTASGATIKVTVPAVGGRVLLATP